MMMTTIIDRPQELVTKIVPGPIPTLLCQNSHFPKHCQTTTICKAPIGTHYVPRASLELGLAIMPPMVVTKALKHAYRLTNFTSLCCDAVRNRYSAELNSIRLFLQNWLYSCLWRLEWYHLKPKRFAGSHQIASKLPSCQESPCLKV